MADTFGEFEGQGAYRVDPARQVLLRFVATQILPHEAGLRQWLRILGAKSEDVDDVVQEVYCRLLRMTQIDHIGDPRAYLYRTARNVVLEQVRRARVVSILTVQNLDELGVAAPTPTPETETVARMELSRVLGLIANLPERCRRIFELRKIDGLSQAETARMMRVSENVVEKETARGLMVILDDLARVRRGERSESKAPPIGGRKVRHVGD